MDKAIANIEKQPPEKVGRNCKECDKDLIYRFNRRSREKFIACSGYPDCRYNESLKEKEKPKLLDRQCPECNKELIERKANRTGKPFVGCSGFPKCRYVESNRGKKVKKSEKK